MPRYLDSANTANLICTDNEAVLEKLVLLQLTSAVAVSVSAVLISTYPGSHYQNRKEKSKDLNPEIWTASSILDFLDFLDLTGARSAYF